MTRADWVPAEWNQQALEIGLCVASALVHIESVRVVHRDVKPSNIMIREDSLLPVLIDFGIGRSDIILEGEDPDVIKTISGDGSIIVRQNLPVRNNLSILLNGLPRQKVPFWARARNRMYTV